MTTYDNETFTYDSENRLSLLNVPAPLDDLGIIRTHMERCSRLFTRAPGRACCSGVTSMSARAIGISKRGGLLGIKADEFVFLAAKSAFELGHTLCRFRIDPACIKPFDPAFF